MCDIQTIELQKDEACVLATCWFLLFIIVIGTAYVKSYTVFFL